jgi:hypothetical protein
MHCKQTMQFKVRQQQLIGYNKRKNKTTEIFKVTASAPIIGNVP